MEARKEIEVSQSKYNALSLQLTNKQTELIQKDMDITLVRQVHSVFNLTLYNVISYSEWQHVCLFLIPQNYKNMSSLGTYVCALKLSEIIYTKLGIVVWGE